MNIKKTTKRAVLRPYLTAYVTSGQAARHCQVTVAGLRGWIEDRDLRAIRTPGGHYRIELEEFQRFLKRHGMLPYSAPVPEVRILIVDDEPGVLKLLLDFLAADSRGFKLETATDGYEALIKVGSFKPSIVILDVMIPRLDGREVCRRLKGDPETRAIKILGMTGYPETIPALREAGADACLAKPFDRPQVQQELECLLET